MAERLPTLVKNKILFIGREMLCYVISITSIDNTEMCLIYL